MTLYRKKPIVIEARQYPAYNEAQDIDEWFEDLRKLALWCGGYLDGGTYDIIIPTLEGDMHSSTNDYIIKGVQGEFYPCKPDIFEATYEAADDDEDEPYYQAVCGSWDCRAPECKPRDGGTVLSEGVTL